MKDTCDGLFILGLILIGSIILLPCPVLYFGDIYGITREVEMIIIFSMVLLNSILGFKLMGIANQRAYRNFIKWAREDAIRNGEDPDKAEALALFCINSRSDDWHF